MSVHVAGTTRNSFEPAFGVPSCSHIRPTYWLAHPYLNSTGSARKHKDWRGCWAHPNIPRDEWVSGENGVYGGEYRLQNGPWEVIPPFYVYVTTGLD